MLVRDLWYESGAGPGFANIHGRAVLTIDGARVSSPANGTLPAFNIINLDGQVAILSTDIDDRIEISGNGARGKVLALGVMAEQKSSDYFKNAASPPAKAVLLNSRHLSRVPGNRSTATADAGPADPAFIRLMLSHTRGERPEILRALPSRVTDVRFFRVGVANGINNITLNAESPSFQTPGRPQE